MRSTAQPRLQQRQQPGGPHPGRFRLDTDRVSIARNDAGDSDPPLRVQRATALMQA